MASTAPADKLVSRFLLPILESGSGGSHRPAIDKNHESNVPGLYVIGDLAGAPVIKLAMAQGVEVIEHIASLHDAKSNASGVLDVLVIGAGAAGLNAALAAQDKGLTCAVLEKAKIANTIENFPEGKWVYAEPDSKPPKGKLWLDGATKEDLVARWHRIVDENRLDVRAEEPLESLDRGKDGVFTAVTPRGSIRARRVVLATGQRGNPRKLGVAGEEREQIYHRLYSPRKYENEDILVVGGGNSAIEAALTLAERNRVTLSYRGEAFSRLFKDNERKLDEAIAAKKIVPLLRSNVTEFGDGEATIEIDGEKTRRVPFRHAFVLIGADVPVEFLRKLGIRLENDWRGRGSFPLAAALGLATLAGLWLLGGKSGVPAAPPFLGGVIAAAALAALLFRGLARSDRFAWLSVSFLVCYTIYGAKLGKGEELWPYRGWGYEALSFAGRSWSFWYTVLYTSAMTVFGLKALKRWGLEKKDRFQIWRYVSLLGFQWVFFFLVPEFLFQWAVRYQWVPEALAADPQFADQAWRSYGIVYAWPLFFYTFFYDPHTVWVVWGVLLTFVLIPLFVVFMGKRYCSWICGCGGLAETLGDRWRHLAPKGKTSIRWERMNAAVLILAFVVTGAMLIRDTITLVREPAEWSLNAYRLVIDVWLVGILPVTLYPFLGGKVWCRYWCPLAKMMQIQSKFFSKIGISRFKIKANDKCISCNECTRYCQVGIDVQSYALKQEVLDNRTSSCIGCGICVSVCPMDVLSFGGGEEKPAKAAPPETVAAGR